VRIADVLPMKKALVHAVQARREQYESMLMGTAMTREAVEAMSDLEVATFTQSVRGLGFNALEAAESLWIAAPVLPEWLGRMAVMEPIQSGSVIPYVRHGIAFFQEPVYLPTQGDPGKIGGPPPAFSGREDEDWGADMIIPIRALSWARGLVPRREPGGENVVKAPGVMVMSWADARDIQPYVNAVRAEQGKPEVEWDRGLPMIPVAFASAADGGWFEVEPDGLLERAYNFDGDAPDHPARATTVAAVHLLWQMLSEDILISRREEQPRRQQKMMRRVRLKDTSVTTVHLRHRTYDRPAEPGEETRAQYSHRFMVRGHPRKIHDKRTGEVREVWVRPYVKGPEDAPLKIREHVYSLDR
jgi:hypothetical protein